MSSGATILLPAGARLHAARLPAPSASVAGPGGAPVTRRAVEASTAAQLFGAAEEAVAAAASRKIAAAVRLAALRGLMRGPEAAAVETRAPGEPGASVRPRAVGSDREASVGEIMARVAI